MGAVATSGVAVTGAGGALGAAITAHYLGQGRPVLALDREPTLLAALGSHKGLFTAAVDLTNDVACAAAFDEHAGIGDVGLLVNAVGLIENAPVIAFKGAKLRRHDLDTWRRLIDANLTAAFVACTVATERMARRGGGVIINFSSVVARGNAGQSAYAAAKSGVEGMTRAMAQELGPYNIRVNAIAPGFIDVSSTRNALTSEQIDSRVARTPLKRLGAVEEIAAALEAIENNPFMTGVVLPIDGGVVL